MYTYIKRIEERLTDNDKRQLSDIYAPQIVATPDRDPWGRLTVMPDGRIRFYGEYKKKSVFDHDCDECYIESCDGGLSWKRHIITNKNVLGASAYMPFCGKYVKVHFNHDFDASGTFAYVGNDPDDENPEIYKVSDKTYVEPRMPFVMRSRNRILVVAAENRPESHPTCHYNVVLYSDDCGKTWKVSKLGEAPYHEKKWPHKGYRWQQNNRECTIEELSDGSLLMHSRTVTDYHYMSRSFDGGETWSEFEPTTFHSTGTMPVLKRLSDGRILFFWCNTKLLPELSTADGIWEDVFTNRDANHVAISEDDGKTWKGFREMALNPHRHAADFRSVGGPECDRDKSVHQFEAMELPFNKILIVYGQHYACRRIAIFDIDWLYEKSRHEDFIHGLDSISAQNYVKSILGGHKGNPENANSFAGHCAYNRICGCLLVPNPLDDGHEVLQVASNPDPRLITPICGAVWNFPAAKKGKVTLSANIFGKGLRVSLLDHWMNPSDDTVEYYANFSIKLRSDMHPEGELFSDFVFEFDCDKETVKISCGDYLYLEKRLDGKYPNGLCYLHLQSVEVDDTDGAYISAIDFKGE